MERRNIIAHRGYWGQKLKKNSFEALKNALEAGFGVETDLRDCNGDIVVSHDPPMGDVLKARAFLELYAELGAEGRLALNIKADGLEHQLSTLLSETGVLMKNCYAFDMSVPDALKYISSKFPAYTRQSEYEQVPPFLNLVDGVWIDNFSGDFSQVSEAHRLLATGTRVCIVSSELHQRDHISLWDEIASAELHKYPSFEICTDFPEEAHNFFSN